MVLRSLNLPEVDITVLPTFMGIGPMGIDLSAECSSLWRY
jgi:hypothetical protein